MMRVRVRGRHMRMACMILILMRFSYYHYMEKNEKNTGCCMIQMMDRWI